MNKIPSVFLRDPENMNLLTREPHPDALWVLAGEGLATRKYDGTCVMVDADGKWWARREVKPGKVTPLNWIPVEKDDVTGKIMGWEPIEQSGFRNFLGHAVALRDFSPGTYELCGPKINGNPEKLDVPTLFKHEDAEVFLLFGRPQTYDYDRLRETVLFVNQERGWEGIVWHHADGRMAKLKAKDFGYGK